MRAAIHMAYGEIEKAIEIYKKLCEKESNNGDNWLNLACCQRELKHIVEPWNTVINGLKKSPAHEGLQLAMVQLIADLGKVSKLRQY